MILLLLNIALSLLSVNNNNFQSELKDYITKSFSQYDSVSYSIQDDLREVASIELNNSRTSNRIGSNFFVAVTFIDKYGISKEKYLTVVVKLFQNVRVVKFPISKGETIDNSNTTLQLMEVTELNHNPFVENTKLGMVIAKYELQPGSIVCNDHLEDSPVMNVGDQINLIYQVGTVQVSLVGTVRQSGTIGEAIKIRANNQQYTAKVINSHEAIIIE